MALDSLVSSIVCVVAGWFEPASANGGVVNACPGQLSSGIGSEVEVWELRVPAEF